MSQASLAFKAGGSIVLAAIEGMKNKG